MTRLVPFLCALAAGFPALADAPEVVAAAATREGQGWRIDVTLRHPDTGWDHYANGWQVLAPDGTEIGYRDLTHPHVDEQPFERSLSRLTIPEDITYVLIRPRCNLDGWSGRTYRLDLSR